MSSFLSILPTPQEIDSLRSRLQKGSPTLPFAYDPKFCSMIAALGIQQEVGTINDELSKFIYDPVTEKAIPRENFRAEIIEYKGFTGVRIWAVGYDRIQIRLVGLRELLHPTFSFLPDGTVRQCVIFPESVAKVALLQGAELVVVREWAINTIFGGFDRTKRFYETNTWELVQEDALRYSKLLSQRQISLLGTHDLVAHISGIRAPAIERLKALGAETFNRFSRYFGSVKKPPVYALVLPYAAGVLLDDLAQPQNYDSQGRRWVFDEIMSAIDQRAIRPKDTRHLTRFPDSYEKLIMLARSTDSNQIKLEAKSLCNELIRELQQLSVIWVDGLERIKKSA